MALDGRIASTRIHAVHRVALDLTPAQENLFSQCAGIARFSWNWALDLWQRQHQARREDPSLPAPGEAALRRQLNAIKDEAFPWMATAPKGVPQQAIKNLGQAYARFFKGLARYPRFKSKETSRLSFRPDNGPGTFRVDGRRLKLPRIGWVGMHEAYRFGPDRNPDLKSVVISKEGGRWFAAIMAEIDHEQPLHNHRPAVGVDLGVTDLATLSTGEKVAGPKALRSHLRKLAKLQRSHARKMKGGKNRARSRSRIARLHARIRNIRQDSLHKLTTMLSRRFGSVVIEDLNVRGMMGNGRLARAIADMGFYEFRRQLGYKLERAGGRLVVADRFFPSSKTCSGCHGKVDQLPLSVRSWTCATCGADHDRDINAAINLLNLAGSEGSNARPVTACGEEGSGSGIDPAVKPASEKQETDLDQKRSGP